MALTPTFTVHPYKNSQGYYVRMDSNFYGPLMHIGEFKTEREAETWIKEDSAEWLGKRAAPGAR